MQRDTITNPETARVDDYVRRPTAPLTLRRHADHIEALRQRGIIPTGDIELHPQWRRDYGLQLSAHCDEQGL